MWVLHGVGGKEKDTRKLWSSGLVGVPGPCDILVALPAELSIVSIFKGAWFALTLRVPGGVASSYFIFI